MGLADELQTLEQLRSSGALSEEEFQQAKARLLAPPAGERGSARDDGNESLGRAANRYVSFQIVMAVIGFIVFLIFFFSLILPRFSGGPSFHAPPFP